MGQPRPAAMHRGDTPGPDDRPTSNNPAGFTAPSPSLGDGQPLTMEAQSLEVMKETVTK